MKRSANEVCRQEIGRQLDALVLCLECVRQRRDRTRLGQSRYAFQEYVAIRQEPRQQALEHPLLSYDDPRHRLHYIVYKPAMLGD